MFTLLSPHPTLLQEQLLLEPLLQEQQLLELQLQKPLLLETMVQVQMVLLIPLPMLFLVHWV